MFNIKLKKAIKKFAPKLVLEKFLELYYYRSRIPRYCLYTNAVNNKNGIEIGGPSLIFKTILPLYQKVKNLDNVNFSSNTAWEVEIRSGPTFNYFNNRVGIQHILEATNLSTIESSKYDFLLSSNCLEHTANPIKAIIEWRRIMRPGAFFVLVLPNKKSNFDHRRPTTTYDHIANDYANNTTEGDLTHLTEIMDLHDLSMDLQAGTFEDFKKRSLDNYNSRMLHHHIFDVNLIEEILKYTNFEITHTCETFQNYYALSIKK